MLYNWKNLLFTCALNKIKYLSTQANDGPSMAPLNLLCAHTRWKITAAPPSLFKSQKSRSGFWPKNNECNWDSITPSPQDKVKTSSTRTSALKEWQQAACIKPCFTSFLPNWELRHLHAQVSPLHEESVPLLREEGQTHMFARLSRLQNPSQREGFVVESERV